VIGRGKRALLLAVALPALLGARTAGAHGGSHDAVPHAHSDFIAGDFIPGEVPTTGAGGLPLAPQSATPGTKYAGFNPLERSERLLDTRTGNGAPAAPVGAAQSITVQLAGRGSVPLDADAVVMNVTGDAPTAIGFLTVYPAGTSVPDTSNLNLVPGRTVANLVVIRLTDGKASFFNAFGTTHVLADVLAYSRADGHFSGFAPERFLDTRAGVGVPAGKVGAGARIDVSVLGRGTVPADPSRVGAVVVNITADQPSAPSFVTVWPSGVTMPNASSLNFVAGQTVANLVFAPVGADGRISLFNERGDTNLIGDIVGWIPAGAAYTPVTPVRVLDTRTGLGGEAPLRGLDYLFVDLRSRFAYAPGVGAVVLNVTAAGTTDTSYLTVYTPNPIGPPDTSNINTVAGQNTANAVVVRPGSNGYLIVRNERGYTDVIVDLVGYVPLQNALDQVSDSTGSMFHVLYVLGADSVADPTMVANIRAELELADQWFLSETGQRFDIDRTNGQIDVVTWQLHNYTEAQILNWQTLPGFGPLLQLADDGFGWGDGRRYLVYIDGTANNGFCGYAWSVFATVYQSGGCGSVLAPATSVPAIGATVNTGQVALHEMLHALGAVPNCATNASDFHVSGPSNDLMWTNLGTDKHVDIGRDDYFGHSIPGCLDVEDSPFLSGTPG
jgi:hypothetical protein